MMDKKFSDVELLTVAEVAGILRVSKMTVYRMVHSGELSSIRVGRSFRIHGAAVEPYLDGSDSLPQVEYKPQAPGTYGD